MGEHHAICAPFHCHEIWMDSRKWRGLDRLIRFLISRINGSSRRLKGRLFSWTGRFIEKLKKKKKFHSFWPVSRTSQTAPMLRLAVPKIPLFRPLIAPVGGGALQLRVLALWHNSWVPKLMSLTLPGLEELIKKSPARRIFARTSVRQNETHWIGSRGRCDDIRDFHRVLGHADEVTL